MLLPGEEKEPAGHGEHEPLPGEGEKKPPGHGVQEALPGNE